MNADPTIFIVDDDEGIRNSLSRALTKRGFSVQSYPSAQTFLEAYTPDQTGCLLLDYGMPDVSGLELQKRLLEKDYSIPVIFITGHGGVPESVQAIKAGAIDFLEKPFKQEVLLELINKAFETDATMRSRKSTESHAKARLENLTQRESEIANWIVANPGNSSSKEIARNLDISPRTVDHHRARIFEKLGIKSVAELVDLSLKTGR